VPTPLLDHPRVGGEDPVDHAAKVHVDDAIPVRQRHLVGRAADRETRIVEEEIYGAIACGCLIDQFAHGVEVTNIDPPAFHLGRVSPCSGNPVGGAHCSLAIAVGQHDPGAVGNQLGCECPADA
jgi:hypothetical protein